MGLSVCLGVSEAEEDGAEQGERKKKIPRMVVAPREISRSGLRSCEDRGDRVSVSYCVFTVRPFSPARLRQE